MSEAAEVALHPLPPDAHRALRRDAILDGYKWDPQVGDTNTVADHVALLSEPTAARLSAWAESLAGETSAMEAELVARPDLSAELGLPRAVCRALTRANGRLPTAGVSLMRFDFHPTETGWAVSEVNRDVPGGLAEAAWLARAAAPHVPHSRASGHVGDALATAFRLRLGRTGRIGCVHATAYSDDRQVMQFVADSLVAAGHTATLLAPDHVVWHADGAESCLLGEAGPLDAIVRFFPAEWLPLLPARSRWTGYFGHALPACNHATAILTQSKRLPLVWDRLRTCTDTWRRLLPETRDPRDLARDRGADGAWILKPALGRVGEDITVPGVLSPPALRRVQQAARRTPRDWVAQRLFRSRALPLRVGTAHLCVGVFTVDGRAAGFYGRISHRPRIDAEARDIAVRVAVAEGDNAS